MLSILISFVLPLIIIAIPLLAVLIICNRQYIKSSFERTLTVSIISFVVGLFTPFVAITVSANGLAMDMPKDQPNCVEGAVIFFPLGLILTIVTFAFALYYCIDNFKINNRT